MEKRRREVMPFYAPNPECNVHLKLIFPVFGPIYNTLNKLHNSGIPAIQTFILTCQAFVFEHMLMVKAICWRPKLKRHDIVYR